MPQANAKVAIELHVDDQGTLRVKEFSDKSKEEFREVEQAGSGAAGKIGSSWTKVVGIWGLVATAASAVFAAVSALVITAANEASELENLSRLAKMGSDEFREYAHATESVGISAEKLSDISKDVQDKLGDFISTGGGKFLDFFEKVAPKVGLTAQELQKMSGPDVLVAVKKAMDDANVSSAEQIFYLESIADDASLLIPLLENSGKALKDKAARAKELGIALSEVDSKNLVEAGTAATETGSAFGGLKNTIAAEFAPVVTDAMRWVTDLIVDWKDEARAVAGTFANIAQSFQGMKAVTQGRLGFFEFAKMDAKELDEWLNKNRKSMETVASTGTKTQSQYRKEIEATTKAINAQEKARQEIIDKHKDDAEDQADAEREMYEEAGIGAEKYFSAEATELVKKAARWEKAGADTYQTEQWLYDQLGKLSEDAWAKGETAAGQAMDTMQNMTETLVEQYDATTISMNDKLTAVGLKIDELDGQNIGLTASFDGGGVVTTVDTLIAKFQALRAAASSAAAATSGAMTSSDSSLSISSSSSDQSSSSSSTGSDSAPAGGASNSVTVNVNQQLSRSDVNSIVSEQKRLAGRM